jgi:hypothetical protein
VYWVKMKEMEQGLLGGGNKDERAGGMNWDKVMYMLFQGLGLGVLVLAAAALVVIVKAHDEVIRTTNRDIAAQGVIDALAARGSVLPHCWEVRTGYESKTETWCAYKVPAGTKVPVFQIPKPEE